MLDYEQEIQMTLDTLNTMEQLSDVWWKAGFLSGDETAFERSEALISEAIEVYRSLSLITELMGALEQQALGRWNRGVAFQEPARIAEAASIYSDARDLAEKEGLEQAFIEFSLKQAKATDAARLRGVPLDGPGALAILEEAMRRLDDLGDDKTQAEAELETAVAELYEEMQ